MKNSDWFDSKDREMIKLYNQRNSLNTIAFVLDMTPRQVQWRIIQLKTWE